MMSSNPARAGSDSRVSAIAKSVYNYDTGGVLRNLGDKDDRVVAKIDANISDTQRLALTYTYANDTVPAAGVYGGAGTATAGKNNGRATYTASIL